MKRWNTTALAALLSVIVVLLLVSDVRGEVSARRERDRVRTLVAGGPLASIADDPDPVPNVTWEPFVPSSTERRHVNPSGDLRPDGRPFVAYHPTSGWPVVVWSFNNGGEHDVAIAWWTGQAWSDVHFLTANPEDELHPKAAVGPDGTMHVVWTVDAEEPWVAYSSFSNVTIDAAPSTRVTPPAEPGIRPSVAVVDGEVWIAYERGPLAGTSTPLGTVGEELVSSALPGSRTTALELAGQTVEPPVANRIVLRRRMNDGSFSGLGSFDSTRADALDVELHAHGGHVWLDWKQSATQLGFTWKIATGWNQARQQPWSDPSWIGEEDARRSVRRTVLASPLTAPTDPGD